ncbi:ABC transporter ATP-binding protein [Uliginosibacterium sp. H1]|uniref:ABC transporter ATP-binding protein n=1 Tax=Uliginosibacterium sp. H1 TaxID=3114757 RepID=UPI002E17903A|nr:ABC transporter ATP-binding protein [Uliginosibacterium sp. H1]
MHTSNGGRAAVPAWDTNKAFGLQALFPAIWFFLAEDRRRYLLHLGIFTLGQAYELVPPLLIGLMVDFLIGYRTGDSLLPLVWMIGGLGISNAVNAIIRLRSRRKLGQFALNSRYRARLWGFERLMSLSLGWHQRESTGNKAQRVQTGADAVRDWTLLHNDVVPPLVAFVGTLVACMVLHPACILFFVVYIAGLAGLEYYFDRAIARVSQRINASTENASGVFVESASNILAVKAMGAGESMASRVQQREEVARQLGHERIRLSNMKWIGFQVHNSLAWVVFLAGIAYAVMSGKLGVGLVLTYSQYFNSMRMSAMTFTDRFQVLVERFADLSRMMPLFAKGDEAARGAQAFPRQWQDIRFRQLGFAYEGRAVLDGFDLQVKRGEKLGVAGRSGSGKSTLVKLLLGLYRADRGKLEIGGVSLDDIEHDSLTSHVSVVLQETELFGLSLRDNITVMREVDPELFRRACHIACLDEVVAQLPNGLDTLVGERGYALSGGQRQRVGIARALCRSPSLLLLDEATSALDAMTEQSVMSRLMAEIGDETTLIIVAHRIRTLMGADRIIVMEQGRIVEEGRYQDLAIHERGHFAGMLDLQTV